MGPELLRITLFGFILGGVGMAVANRTAAPHVRRQRWLKFGVYFAIVHGIIAVAWLGALPLRGLLLVLIALCLYELRAVWRTMPHPRPLGVWPLALLMSSFATLGLYASTASQLVWLFLVVACADGFAQIIGQLFGRRALAARVSPGKTIEGAIGGIAAAITTAAALHASLPRPALDAAAAGLAVAAAALAGDLCASWVKRRAGIKDYSAALPGQGGFLDRFDSLIGALALCGLVRVLQC